MSKQISSPTVVRVTDPFFLKLINKDDFCDHSTKTNVFQDGLFNFFFFMIFKETKVFVWAWEDRELSECSRCASLPPLACASHCLSAAAHPEHTGRAASAAVT